MSAAILPELPYFYGSQAEQSAFYRIPKVFFTLPVFSSLSTDAKVLYGLMLDRLQLSARNEWLDEQGARVYFYYTLENIKYPGKYQAGFGLRRPEGREASCRAGQQIWADQAETASVGEADDDLRQRLFRSPFKITSQAISEYEEGSGQK